MFGLNNIKILSKPSQQNGKKIHNFFRERMYLISSILNAHVNKIPSLSLSCLIPIFLCGRWTHTRKYTYTLSLSQYVSVLLFKMSIVVLCFLYLKKQN